MRKPSRISLVNIPIIAELSAPARKLTRRGPGIHNRYGNKKRVVFKVMKSQNSRKISIT
jgi:hypothetical protein